MNRRSWTGALALVMCVACAATVVFAQGAPPPGDTVAVTTPAAASVPWGAWLTQGLAWGRDLAVLGGTLLVGVASRHLPAAGVSLIKAYLTEQTIGRAVDYAIAAVDKVVAGQTLDLPVANAVIYQAERYAIANAPLLAKWLGDTLRPKIVARLSAKNMLPADATAAKLSAPLPTQNLPAGYRAS